MLGNRKQVSVAGPEFNKLGKLLFASVWCNVDNKNSFFIGLLRGLIKRMRAKGSAHCLAGLELALQKPQAWFSISRTGIPISSPCHAQPHRPPPGHPEAWGPS